MMSFHLGAQRVIDFCVPMRLGLVLANALHVGYVPVRQNL